jgi:protein O-GlcNAc transferase
LRSNSIASESNQENSGMKPGKNDPCICGSGKKYKHCCEGKVAIRIPIPPPAEIDQLIALYNAGHYAILESRARLLVEQFPDFSFGWKLLGGALQMQGKNALPTFQKSAQLFPDDSEAHYNLGIVLKEAGRLDVAVVSYRRAVELKPDYAEAHNNLGNALKDLGQLDEAIASYRRVVALKPDFVLAHYNLGNAQKDQGQFDDAVASFRRAVTLKPDFSDAHSNLGAAYKVLGQLDAALASFHRVLELKPGFAEAHNNLGAVLKDLGQLDAALASYRTAIELKPDYAEAHYNLGNVLQALEQFEDAVTSYHRAVKINPDFAETHFNLGIALQTLGQLDATLISYRRAVELQPQALQYAIYAYLLLPVIPETLASIAEWRERYQNGIAALMNIPGTLDEPGEKLAPPSFYLAYHNTNDRRVMEALCQLFRARVPDLTATAPHVPGWQNSIPSGKRIRVGFVSQFLVQHTIGKLYQGFIRHLDRNRFEVVVIHGSKSRRDIFRQNLDALADKAITLPAKLKDQQQAVAAEELDVLFYPDIGMAQSTYFLAYARLAPVQVTSWGHPDTTGLDTMDYFVSAASLEPEDAEDHYTERLIRLNRLPCLYRPLITSTQILIRKELGLPETGTLYGCPQTLFKFHPDFDAVLAAIAEGDSIGRIVLLEGHASWGKMLRARWAKSFPVLLERVLFLPHMPLDRFMALIAHMDVLLDPIHFGSGNTMYEAMVYGAPIVTWPGKFMRGRIVAAAYRQMGIADAPIVTRLEDYAPLVLALGRDPERRRALRQALLAATEQTLFADMNAVREFEDFLESAVEAAGRGQKLPVGWRPDILQS